MITISISLKKRNCKCKAGQNWIYSLYKPVRKRKEVFCLESSIYTGPINDVGRLWPLLRRKGRDGVSSHVVWCWTSHNRLYSAVRNSQLRTSVTSAVYQAHAVRAVPSSVYLHVVFRLLDSFLFCVWLFIAAAIRLPRVKYTLISWFQIGHNVQYAITTNFVEKITV